VPPQDAPQRAESDNQPQQELLPKKARRSGWGVALLMAAAPFLLMGLLILADRLLR
jgi:hypothetical protein